METNRAGFSLLELLVVVSIIAVLVTITVFGISDSQAQARDAKRKADLRIVENALELYKNKYGRYPEACNGATTNRNGNGASGETGTNFACGVGNEYIVDLAPEFIPELPRSSQSVSGNQGYVYLVNGERSVYKFMALNVVETETVYDAVRDGGTAEIVTPGHEFHRCGSGFDIDLLIEFYTVPASHSHLDAEMCDRTPDNDSQNYNAGKTAMAGCSNPASNWETTYAVSAGYATPLRTNNLGNSNFPLRGEEYDTEIVRCY